jgi:hypothetical protein
VTQRFILDCKVMGHRPEERNYSWAGKNFCTKSVPIALLILLFFFTVEPTTYAIVPANQLLPWEGSLLRPIIAKSRTRPKTPHKRASADALPEVIARRGEMFLERDDVLYRGHTSDIEKVRHTSRGYLCPGSRRTAGARRRVRGWEDSAASGDEGEGS